MAKITLKEYSERLGKDRAVVYQKYKRGGFKTAEKQGRDIWIDEDEPYIDERIKSGKFINWRYGYQYQKALKERKQAQEQETE